MERREQMSEIQQMNCESREASDPHGMPFTRSEDSRFAGKKKLRSNLGNVTF